MPKPSMKYRRPREENTFEDLAYELWGGETTLCRRLKEGKFQRHTNAINYKGVVFSFRMYA
jgi:hypothetical protein